MIYFIVLRCISLLIVVSHWSVISVEHYPSLGLSSSTESTAMHVEGSLG